MALWVEKLLLISQMEGEIAKHEEKIRAYRSAIEVVRELGTKTHCDCGNRLFKKYSKTGKCRECYCKREDATMQSQDLSHNDQKSS